MFDEERLVDWLGEDVGWLIFSCNLLDLDVPTINIAPKMMVLHVDVSRARSKLVCSAISIAPLLSSKTLQ
jgi:hypothetical protein